MRRVSRFLTIRGGILFELISVWVNFPNDGTLSQRQQAYRQA